MFRSSKVLVPALAALASSFAPRLAAAAPPISPDVVSPAVATPVAVATPAPVPAATAPAPIDADRGASETRAPNATNATGFVASIGGGTVYTGGEIGSGVGLGGVMAIVDAQVGAYVTPHLGVMGGVRYGFSGFATAGCDGCSVTLLQFPVVAQYAFTGRQDGAYLEGGLALLDKVSATGNGGKSSVSVGASAGADVKVGFGWRFQNGTKDKKALLPGALDLKLGADFGRYSSVEVGDGGQSAKADIAEEKRSIHYNVGLTLAYLITP